MKTLCILILLLLCVSCVEKQEIKPNKPFTLHMTAPNFFSTQIHCDSINMISKTEAIYYINGGEFKVFADSFTISSN